MDERRGCHKKRGGLIEDGEGNLLERLRYAIGKSKRWAVHTIRLRALGRTTIYALNKKLLRLYEDESSQSREIRYN
ncbi:MAG: hypothetical protein M0Z71_03950 [Nitrospiraceae bacterium]|nr:hypothetical protein [Nitrospiraceae bacterium]